MRVPIWYGQHLTFDRVRWDALPSGMADALEPDARLMGTVWSTLPFRDEEGRTWFRFCMADPHPGVPVSEITFEPESGLEAPVEWKDVRRCR
jgi:hypothetical protein